MTLLLPNHSLKVETDRFGPFLFQIGCAPNQIETLLLRVSDAQQRFNSSPFSRVAHLLEKEVVATSVFGTNTIEGGTLTEEETREALELDPDEVQKIEHRRVINIKAAYELSRQKATSPSWHLSTQFLGEVHSAVTDQLPHELNRPGLIRNNSKSLFTYVGDEQHGGRYKAPQYSKDIEKLLAGLVQFDRELSDINITALVRAPLVHYYYELIHPYWDGNGRVGRIAEAAILQANGFRYAPFAQAGYYLQHVDKYFTLFNSCRKAANKGQEFPVTPFVSFFLEGMLESLNKLHDRVNELVKYLIYETHIKRALDDKRINARQYAIASQLLLSKSVDNLKSLRHSPWYIGLYEKLTDKTRRRDLKGLIDLNLIAQNENNEIRPCI